MFTRFSNFPNFLHISYLWPPPNPTSFFFNCNLPVMYWINTKFLIVHCRLTPSRKPTSDEIQCPLKHNLVIMSDLHISHITRNTNNITHVITKDHFKHKHGKFDQLYLYNLVFTGSFQLTSCSVELNCNDLWPLLQKTVRISYLASGSTYHAWCLKLQPFL